MRVMTKQGVRQRLSGYVTGRTAKLSVILSLVVVWLFTPWSLASLVSSVARNGVAVLTVLAKIPDAVGLLQEEYDRTTAERDAFDRFARRVAALDPADSAGAQPRQTIRRQSGGTAHAAPGSIPEHSIDASTASMAEIRKAYRETVMAVPHYEEEYDESFEEHIAQELGTEIGLALSQQDVVTPQLQAALVTGSREARDERTELLNRLENERENLQTASTSLERIQEAVTTVEESLTARSDRELADAWDRLEGLEGDCRDLLSRRQCQIDTGRIDRTIALQEYVYAPREWTYPVLADGLDSVERIRRAKRQVIKTIWQRG